MGLMIDGNYHAEDPGPDTSEDGKFQRQKATIRHWITADGPFTPDPGRYHLYAAWNCPWAHRALLIRALKGLQEQITVAYARPRRTHDGGFQFSSPEMASAVEAEAPVIVMLYDNSGYGEIKSYMVAKQIGTVGVDLYTPDLKAQAEASGWAVAGVADPAELPELLTKAAADTRPTMIYYTDTLREAFQAGL
jgi:glutathionyl-hydroquinone reductase